MFVISITKWRKKVMLLLVLGVFLVCMGIGINWYFDPLNSPAAAPSDNNLQKDILTQPVKVHGQPAPLKTVPQTNGVNK